MIIDIIFATVFAYGFFMGYKAGVIKILLTGFSMLIGLFLAVKFTSDMNLLIKDFFRLDGSFLPIVSFFMTFIASMLVIRLAAQFLQAFLKTMDLDLFNQLAGGLVVASVFLFLYSGLIWFLQKAEILSNDIEVFDEVLGNPRNNDIRIIDPDETVIIRDMPDTLYVLETLPNAEMEEYRYLRKTTREKSGFQNSVTIPFINLFLHQFDVFMETMTNMRQNFEKEMKEIGE